MPLLIVDYVHRDYSIVHGGLLRGFFRQGIHHVEGQVLEVYEGWIGREKVRVANARVIGLLTDKRILLPRDELLKYGIVPRVWIVFSVIRVGDFKREIYYPVYPGRIVSYVPQKDLLMARLEDLMLRSTGLSSKIAGLIYRGLGVIEEIREERRKKK